MPERDAGASKRLERERQLEERALAERLRRAARRPPEENLSAGLELIRTAQAFQSAFGARPRSS